jgi:ATP/maltotriose-dependent transcriptional regulator MalT
LPYAPDETGRFIADTTNNNYVAWLSLDHQDNDPVRFWTYFITALETSKPGIGADALSLLAEPQAPAMEEILTVLINTSADISHKIIMVLDDYHMIVNQPIHEALSFLLEHLPRQLHLIITSRSDPPLALTRLRVRGQLTEIRDIDLRFSPAEAAIFINQVMGMDLSPEDIYALETRTRRLGCRTAAGRTFNAGAERRSLFCAGLYRQPSLHHRLSGRRSFTSADRANSHIFTVHLYSG